MSASLFAPTINNVIVIGSYLWFAHLRDGKPPSLDLSGAEGAFKVQWFNPRNGGSLASGSVTEVQGGSKAALGKAPADAGEDWVVLLRK